MLLKNPDVAEPLILASRSASRMRLLQDMGIPFSVEPTDIDELPIPQEMPCPYVIRMAREKALAGAARSSVHPSYVLAADTIVSVGRRILRKAQSKAEACKQMELLSGRRHRVMTAVALSCPYGKIYERFAQAHVSFKQLHASEIEAFVASKEWEGVAVYRIEGFASRFIRQMNGLSSTVMGLPVYHTYQLLKGQGLL